MLAHSAAQYLCGNGRRTKQCVLQILWERSLCYLRFARYHAPHKEAIRRAILREVTCNPARTFTRRAIGWKLSAKRTMAAGVKRRSTILTAATVRLSMTTDGSYALRAEMVMDTATTGAAKVDCRAAFPPALILKPAGTFTWTAIAWKLNARRGTETGAGHRSTMLASATIKSSITTESSYARRVKAETALGMATTSGVKADGGAAFPLAPIPIVAGIFRSRATV